jgi:hypothetical protein
LIKWTGQQLHFPTGQPNYNHDHCVSNFKICVNFSSVLQVGLSNLLPKLTFKLSWLKCIFGKAKRAVKCRKSPLLQGRRRRLRSSTNRTPAPLATRRSRGDLWLTALQIKVIAFIKQLAIQTLTLVNNLCFECKRTRYGEGNVMYSFFTESMY